MRTEQTPKQQQLQTKALASRIFWGLLIIGAAVLLILNAVFPAQDIPAVKIIGSVLLLAISIASLTKVKFVLFFLPLALIAYVWRTSPFLAILADVNLWPLILAAVLLGIGMSVIFHRKSHIHVKISSNSGGDGTEETLNSEESVEVDVSWGDNIKYIHASNLKHARIKSAFASAKIYFDACKASPEGLDISVNCSFSELTLILPRNWEINNQISTFVGEISSMPSPRQDDFVRVNLHGSVNFAEMKINYI